MKDLIRNQLLKNRPSLSFASLKTYISLLNGLTLKIDSSKQNDKNLNWFVKNELKIINWVKKNRYFTLGRKLLFSTVNIHQLVLTG